MLGQIRQLATNPHKNGTARAVRQSVAAPRRPEVSLERALDATYEWLCRAQDAGNDGGVARCFDLFSGRFDLSYPETTGYIIPTFLAYADARSDTGARERAFRMADWETEIQMEDGAVLSGVATTPRGPAVFNTGQVLFGWVAAYEEARDDRYATAARRAADWLVQMQDPDGAWRRNLSMLTTGSAPTYNNRCAWALVYAAQALGEPRYLDAARRNADWTIDQQNELGWFAHAGFTDGEMPLLHTISYVIEGLLGVHAFTGEDRYLNAAKKALDRIVAQYRETGRLGGRYDDRWRPTVSWRCVTGDAQIAVALYRLERRYPQQGYAEVGRRLLKDVAVAQLDIAHASETTNPNRGGIPGSWPIWGGYCSFTAVNWAAKFFLDGLLLALYGVDEKSFPSG